MARITLTIVLTLSVSLAAAYELSDNPAFCAGFLAEQTDRHAAMMRTHESRIIRAFNLNGPKDSTDGRGYTEWLHEGVNAARDRNAPDYEQMSKRCRSLIERIAQ
jgi:ribonucleotide reductase beta subunit family protein with ferritin-like domain